MNNDLNLRVLYFTALVYHSLSCETTEGARMLQCMAIMVVCTQGNAHVYLGNVPS